MYLSIWSCTKIFLLNEHNPTQHVLSLSKKFFNSSIAFLHFLCIINCNVTYSFSSDSNLQVSPAFNQTDTAYSFVYASTTTSATLNLTTQYAGQEIISSLTPTISSTDSAGQQTLVYIVGSGTYTFTVLSPDKLSQTVYTFTGVSS